MTKFKEGDIVISKNGKYPARVTENNSWGGYTNIVYLHNNSYSTLVTDNLILYNESENMTTETQMLYQFKTEDSSTAYGTHIGTNSKSLWLMEEKGSGRVLTIDPKDAEEVLPYTFSVKMRGNTTHYIGEEGMVSTGDVLLYTGGDYPEIATVTAVNTKNKSARAKFTGRRVVTEQLTQTAV
jgi:hypothetical protein